MRYAVKAMTDADGDTEVYLSHGRVLRPDKARRATSGTPSSSTTAIDLHTPPPPLIIKRARVYDSVSQAALSSRFRV